MSHALFVATASGVVNIPLKERSTFSGEAPTPSARSLRGKRRRLCYPGGQVLLGVEIWARRSMGSCRTLPIDSLKCRATRM